MQFLEIPIAFLGIPRKIYSQKAGNSFRKGRRNNVLPQLVQLSNETACAG